MDPKQVFENFRNNESDLTGEQISTFFDSLPDVHTDELIGNWRGGYFHFQHNEVAKQLDAVRWFGKSIISRDHAAPLVCLDEQNNPYTYQDIGEGVLRMVQFRNGLTTALIYDQLPIIDYFRKVDSNTLLGIMEGKVYLEENEFFYFFLERI
ncbi:DUF4334 domain-containing protein [Chitinophaga solisilvae]|uniref:DUF4334 domain-containing protein n=1 Tax=Chitinophaga solisilvae TaxID=1233460 RepID=UPI0013689A6F|nr:DUF4334 domain-containing protein [Chitinophaga solisilvae]